MTCAILREEFAWDQIQDLLNAPASSEQPFARLQQMKQLAGSNLSLRLRFGLRLPMHLVNFLQSLPRPVKRTKRRMRTVGYRIDMHFFPVRH